MKHATSPEIEQYCIESSSRESAVRSEIADYTRQNHPKAQMLIGPLEASFLQILIRAMGAMNVLEIGCFTGYSALAMAEALPSGGKLTTLDVADDTTEIARSFWKKSPDGHKITAIVGPALESMADLSGPFDFVFIDADKATILEYVQRALARLAPKGVIAVDNTLWSGRVMDLEDQSESTRALRKLNAWAAEQPELKTSLLPVRDGILLITRS